jgi:hypothetical protein
MGPAVFILAIMGCGEGNTQCQNVAVMPTHYVTAAACDAGSEAALQRFIDVEYPVVVAQCLKMDGVAAAALMGSDVKLPAPEQAAPAPVKRATYKPGDSARG